MSSSKKEQIKRAKEQALSDAKANGAPQFGRTLVRAPGVMRGVPSTASNTTSVTPPDSLVGKFNALSLPAKLLIAAGLGFVAFKLYKRVRR